MSTLRSTTHTLSTRHLFLISWLDMCSMPIQYVCHSFRTGAVQRLPPRVRCSQKDQEPQPCARGYYRDGSVIACQRCSTGTWTKSTASIRCESCPVGYECPTRIRLIALPSGDLLVADQHSHLQQMQCRLLHGRTRLHSVPDMSPRLLLSTAGHGSIDVYQWNLQRL